MKEKFKSVGNALLPTWTCASTFRCSKRTSIVGISSPTLEFKFGKIEEDHHKLQTHQKIASKRTIEIIKKLEKAPEFQNKKSLYEKRPTEARYMKNAGKHLNIMKE